MNNAEKLATAILAAETKACPRCGAPAGRYCEEPGTRPVIKHSLAMPHRERMSATSERTRADGQLSMKGDGR